MLAVNAAHYLQVKAVQVPVRPGVFGADVDACIGGFLLPYPRRLGVRVPGFDFEVAGMTSISMDLHMNAYTPKGASVVLYRDPELR